MPPRYPIDELVTLHAATQVDDEEAAGEAFDAYHEAFGWIDHRAFESEVVDAFAWQLDDGDVLAWREDDHDRVTPIRNGVEYPVPLTGTGSDRYVMIHSLAEILKDRYTVLLDTASTDSDTHGVLVLPHAQAAALRQRHPKWMKANLEALSPGIDGFSGLKVPWYGHADAAPDFARQRAAMDERFERQKAELRRMFEAPTARDVREGLPGAIEFRQHRLRQRQVSWIYFLSAIAMGVALALGWSKVPVASASAWVVLLANAGAYHAWAAKRMRRGWRPNMAMRWLPLLVLVVLVFLVPGLSR
jgi:hypothetical protein